MLLTVTQTPSAQLLNAGVVVQGGEHVMQRFAAGNVHAHIATGHHRDCKILCQRVQLEVALHFIVAQQMSNA